MDPVARNEWYVVSRIADAPTTGAVGALLLGAQIELDRDAAGAVRCRTTGDRRIALPVIERHGFVWTTLGAPLRDPPDIPEMVEPGRRLIHWGALGVATSAPRVIENFLDLAHLPFVHAGTLGDPANAGTPSYAVELRQDPPELWATDCRVHQPRASAASTAGQDIVYAYRVPSPFAAILYKTCDARPGALDVIGLFVQPCEETVSIAHGFALVFDEQNSDVDILHFQQQIFAQDRPILIGQSPKRLPLSPRRELPTRSDAMSVAYRRWLNGMQLQFGVERAA